MLPVLMGLVIPFVICVAIAFVLRPQGEVEMPKYTYNQKFQAHTYISSSWGEKKIEPYRVTPREDPVELNPIYDSLENLILESERRMLAEILAAEILVELGEEQRKKMRSA